MTDTDWLAEQFESHRPYLRGVAYRMLGSVAEADDAVQESWIRLARSDAAGIENLRAWLTTVVARVSLNVLRSRRSRPESSLEVHVPDPIVTRDDGSDPEQEALLGDAIGLALLVVLDTLTPAERLAFVLHDVFAVPFDEIAPIVGRSSAATRQLASRARRRVQGAHVSDADVAGQRALVDAFLAAAREGDFEGLIAILDPDVVLRADGGPARPKLSALVRGAEAVAAGSLAFRRASLSVQPALVNGLPGAVVRTSKGEPFAVGSFTVRNGRIVAIDILADPDRLHRLDLGAPAD